MAARMMCKSTVLSLPPLKLKATPDTLQVLHHLPLSKAEHTDNSAATSTQFKLPVLALLQSVLLTHTGPPCD